jgi:hypothetical protein
MEKSVGQVLRTARRNENIGSGGTWSSRKTDGGRWLERYPVRSLYVVDMVHTRGVRTMAIGCLEGGGYCGGLHCRQAPVTPISRVEILGLAYLVVMVRLST